jgi:hypothetical protein
MSSSLADSITYLSLAPYVFAKFMLPWWHNVNRTALRRLLMAT